MSGFIGKYVRLRNGEIRGPIYKRDDKNVSSEAYPISDGKTTWTADGRLLTGDRPDSADIVDIVEFIPFYTPGVAEAITKTAQTVLSQCVEKGLMSPSVADTDSVVLTATPSHGRIYLAGPMAGYPERNYPAFMRAAKALRELGYEVYNPAEYEANERFKGQEDRSEFPLREAFTEYTNYILNRADIIALLPGHEKSVGATAELSLARVVKLKEIYL